MRYMIIIKSDAASESGALPDPALLEAMGKYNQQLIEAGALLGGEGLTASREGCRVRWSNGEATVIDGPFSETKELVAGFWLIRADSKQAAIAWVERVPFMQGEIELRRVYDTEDFPVQEGEQPDGWRDKELRFREQAEAGPLPAASAASNLPRFMVMLRSAKAELGALPDQAVLTRMGNLMDELVSKNALCAGEGLTPSKEGARVVFQGKKRSVIDGPFGETKELIAGYTIIRAAAIAEAVEFAKRWLEIHASGTHAADGTIEIRRVMESDEIPVDPSETPDGWREQERKFRERAP